MINAKNKTFLILVVIIFLIGAVFTSKFIRYTNTNAISIAEKFIEYLKNNEFEKAYNLTNKNIYVGENIEKFKTNRELGIILNSKEKMKILEIYPEQTYWNRIGRLVKGKSLNPKFINIEYIGIPFRIQLKFENNRCVIVNFGVHAG